MQILQSFPLQQNQEKKNNSNLKLTWHQIKKNYLKLTCVFYLNVPTGNFHSKRNTNNSRDYICFIAIEFTELN